MRYFCLAASAAVFVLCGCESEELREQRRQEAAERDAIASLARDFREVDRRRSTLVFEKRKALDALAQGLLDEGASPGFEITEEPCSLEVDEVPSAGNLRVSGFPKFERDSSEEAGEVVRAAEHALESPTFEPERVLVSAFSTVLEPQIELGTAAYGAYDPGLSFTPGIGAATVVVVDVGTGAPVCASLGLATNSANISFMRETIEGGSYSVERSIQERSAMENSRRNAENAVMEDLRDEARKEAMRALFAVKVL